MACEDAWWHASGPDLERPAWGVRAATGETAGEIFVVQCGVDTRPAVPRVVVGPPHALADPRLLTAWADWPPCEAKVGGALCHAILAALVVASAAAPTPWERGQGTVVSVGVGRVWPRAVPGWKGPIEPGVACGKDDFIRRAGVLGVERDPVGAEIGVHKNGPPVVIPIYLNARRDPEPR